LAAPSAISASSSNLFAGRFVEDLRPLFEAGAILGEPLTPDPVKLVDGPAVSYGRGAIIGVDGEMEHGGACVHPIFGRPMWTAISAWETRCAAAWSWLKQTT
jgi:hypothetical protein